MRIILILIIIRARAPSAGWNSKLGLGDIQGAPEWIIIMILLYNHYNHNNTNNDIVNNTDK